MDKPALEMWQLKQLQSMSLNAHERRTERKIAEWYGHFDGMVFVSVSGIDSCVLATMARRLYGDSIPLVFCDTGLEFPEVRRFWIDNSKSMRNVIIVRPRMTFAQVLDKYGFPVPTKDQACCISRFRKTKSLRQKIYRIGGFPRGKKGSVSKKWQYLIRAPFKISDACCDVMKKEPLERYAKETGRRPMIGETADEGDRRVRRYLQHGCNAFSTKKPISRPIGFWTKDKVWEYASIHGVEYPPIYDMGYDRTGCMFCMFGIHMEKGLNRFQRMKQTHPKQWAYCMDKLKCREVCEFIGVPVE